MTENELIMIILLHTIMFKNIFKIPHDFFATFHATSFLLGYIYLLLLFDGHYWSILTCLRSTVWSRSAHTSQVDVQLNSTMRLMSGTFRSTPLPSSNGFQCPPTLNRQPYEGRLPLTSSWRKSSNMTVGQSSLISLAHHCYDWHPGSRCG